MFPFDLHRIQQRSFSFPPAALCTSDPDRLSPFYHAGALRPQGHGPEHCSPLQQTERACDSLGRPTPLSHLKKMRWYSLTLRQTCSRPKPRAQFAFKDSMIHVQCRSHYVSHFAAFFIVARAKISVVESCLGLYAVSSYARSERRFCFSCVAASSQVFYG